MVTPVAVGSLAAALLLLPGPPGRGRLRALRTDRPGPGPGDRYRRHLPLLVVVGCAATGAVALGPVGGVCAALGAVAVGRARRRAAAARLAAATGSELADALARIADEVRTGAHPASALTGVVHDGPHARALLAPAEAAARLGEPVPAALLRSARVAHGTATAQEMERVAAAWDLADRFGAPLAELLTGALEDIRWRLGHASRLRAQLAGPRSTAAVLTALPLLGVGLGQLMGTDPLGVLRDGLLGQSLLLVGCGLTAAGTAWSEHILRSAVAT